MAKKKRRQHKWEPTKHQLSRQQQQKKRQRLFLIIGISVMSVVAGIIGGGWYRDEYLPRQELVIRVNDTEFNMGYYLDMLKIQGEPYLQACEAGQAEIYMQLMADEVERFIQENELMRQAALGFGIEVTNREINEALKESDPPLSRDYWELMEHDLLVQKLLDEHFELEVPMSGEQRHIMAMFLESESQAVSARARLVELGALLILLPVDRQVHGLVTQLLLALSSQRSQVSGGLLQLCQGPVKLLLGPAPQAVALLLQEPGHSLSLLLDQLPLERQA